MNDTTYTLDVGLHVCTFIERTADGNLAGVDCDKSVYDSMDTLYAAVIGRSPTVHRELRFILNGSIVERVVDNTSSNMLYSYTLDDRFIGNFEIIYVEQGCNYWKRSFTMGICPTAIVRPQIEISRLVDLLVKFRV